MAIQINVSLRSASDVLGNMAQAVDEGAGKLVEDTDAKFFFKNDKTGELKSFTRAERDNLADSDSWSGVMDYTSYQRTLVLDYDGSAKNNLVKVATDAVQALWIDKTINHAFNEGANAYESVGNWATCRFGSKAVGVVFGAFAALLAGLWGAIKGGVLDAIELVWLPISTVKDLVDASSEFIEKPCYQTCDGGPCTASATESKSNPFSPAPPAPQRA